MIMNEGFQDRMLKAGEKKSANEHLVDADGVFLVKYRPAGFLPSYTDHENFGMNGLPDMSYVEAASNDISKNMRKGQLIVLESTTYPGTTKELVKPILEKSSLIAGEDFFLAYSPEREDPGNKEFTV